jgi:hypothetical protein
MTSARLIGGKLNAKLANLAAPVLLCGCAFVPVQQTNVPQPGGGVVTCTQRGAGVVSYWVGKTRYDKCVEDARGMGGDVARLVGQPLSAVIQKLGYPGDKTRRVGSDTVYAWEKNGCTIEAGVNPDGIISHADHDGDRSDCKSYRNALEQP